MATALLHGTILDDGLLPCEGRFNYGLTTALGTTTPWQGGALRTGDAFQYRVSGLIGHTRYYFRAESRNAIGIGTGGILSFVTISGWSGGGAVPVVVINPATNIGTTIATLQGSLIDDVGEVCDTCFEYGGTPAYGSRTPWVSGFVSGSNFFYDIADLSPGSGFHCRAVARNRYGVGYSQDGTFNTLSDMGSMSGIPMEYLLLLREV